MGEPAQGGFDAPDDDGHIRPKSFQDLGIDDGGVFGTHIVASVGRVGILATQALVGGIFVHHRVHTSGRYAKEQTGTAQLLEVAEVVPPVGLGHDGHPQALGFEQASYHGCPERGVIDIRIATEQDDIEFIPSAKLHFLLGGGEPVGESMFFHSCGFIIYFNVIQRSVATKNLGNIKWVLSRSFATLWMTKRVSVDAPEILRFALNDNLFLVVAFSLLAFFRFLLPLDVEQHQLMKSECLHIVVVNHVDAEVKEVLAISFGRGDERTDVQFQLVEYHFVNDAVAVNQVLEEGILLDGLQVHFRYFHTSGARSVCLYGVHILLCLWFRWTNVGIICGILVFCYQNLFQFVIQTTVGRKNLGNIYYTSDYMDAHEIFRTESSTTRLRRFAPLNDI